MSSYRFELRNKEQGVKIRLSGELIRVGRAEDNTVVLGDPSISRYHVILYPKDNTLIVEDAGSKTGFFVNGVAQKNPTALKNNDILKVGSQVFSVFISDGAGIVDDSFRVPTTSKPEVDALDESELLSKHRRKILYGAVAAFLLAVIFGGSNPETPPLAGSEADLNSESISRALAANVPATARRKSRGEIEAEGKFQEGMREYTNGNFVRAVNRFEEALTQDPNMGSAADYLQFSQGRLKKQVDDLMQDGQRSFALLQYSRAKAQFAFVLSIMSEQIPGYWQQMAQKTLSNGSEARNPAQEETLLSIPCDRTKEQATCRLAVELIKQARSALGEEDTIR